MHEGEKDNKNLPFGVNSNMYDGLPDRKRELTYDSRD